MTVNKNKILVRISDSIRDKIFQKPIVDVLGRSFNLLTKLQESAGFDEFFAQGVQVGEITAVGDGVEDIQVGDDVILDYLIDTDEKNIVETGDGYKICVANAVTTYMEQDRIINPTQRNPKPTIVHRKGELNEGSMVLAYVRKNVITPVAPYIILEYKPEDDSQFINGEAEWSRSKTDPVGERVVISSYKGSDIKPGDTVLIESSATFTREFGDNMFDFAYGFDVIAIEVK